MKIDHLAIWCENIETMRAFYTTYFACVSNEKYHNPEKRYTSYFLTFNEAGARIELMHRADILDEPAARGFARGMAHFDIVVGDQGAVDRMTERLRRDGYKIESEPRQTGDGYYEAGIIDPEGNYIEISAK